MSSSNSDTSASPSLYQSLDTTRSEIRLLKILATPDAGNQVLCQLQSVSLASKPNYFALSYQWSPPTPPECQPFTLRLPQGQTLILGANLSSFLLKYSILFAQNNHYLRVDAICINQDDFTERASQVGIMADIYRNAMKVIARLGPGSKGSRAAINMVKTFDGWKTSTRSGTLGSAATRLSYAVNAKKDMIAASHALTEMLDRPFWSRQWIQQEIGNVDRVLLCCGSDMVESTHVLDLIFHQFVKIRFRALSKVEDVEIPYVAAIGFRVLTKRFHEVVNETEQERADLLRNLIDMRYSFTSNKHDKIYSILSFVDARIREKFQPDYDVPWQELYRRVAVYILEDLGYFDLLVSATESADQLPSWCPDWSLQELDYCYNPRVEIGMHDDIFNPEHTGMIIDAGSYSTGGHATGQFNPLIDKLVLKISVIPIGRVKTIHRIKPPNTGIHFSLEDLIRVRTFLASDQRRSFLSDPYNGHLFMHLFRRSKGR